MPTFRPLLQVLLPFQLCVMVLLSLPSVAEPNLLGKIEFPNSGASEAQEDFINGVLYLHNFEYDEAAESFRRAIEIDKDFVMAHWGEAMCYHHPLWNKQSRQSGREVLYRLGRTHEDRASKAATQREKDYIRSLEILYGMTKETRSKVKDQLDIEYRDFMRRMHEKYPDDDEITVFYGLSILGAGSRDRDFATYMRAAAELTPVWEVNKSHPGAAHYLIHAYDDPIHAPLGLPMAQAYSRIAPAAAHAQHMTSHIFVALGMWDDLVTANETAIRIETESNDKLQPLGHYEYWLEYGYLQQGRYEDAQSVVRRVLDNAKDAAPSINTIRYGTIYARYIIDTEDWSSYQELAASKDEKVATPYYHFARAYAAIHRNDLEAAREHMRFVVPVDGQFLEAVGSKEIVEVLRLELESLLAFASGESEKAEKIARQALDAEKALPFQYGPPQTMKPTHEFLGDLLLKLDRPDEAANAYKSQLELTPLRSRSLLGLVRATAASPESSTAIAASQQLTANWVDADRDVNELRKLRD